MAVLPAAVSAGPSCDARSAIRRSVSSGNEINMAEMLAKEEYIEQAYLFRSLADQSTLEPELQQPLQTMLGWLKQEVLATTKLPMAIDFLIGEIKHLGTMSTSMARMPHYFAPFQTYLVQQAEEEGGRFDIWQAFRILQQEAELRARQVPANALFFFQFETLCRNRLSYDHGLEAMSRDPAYHLDWARWILSVRHKIGIVDITDLVYVHSAYYVINEQRRLQEEVTEPSPLLFSEKEGRVALANRHKEPLFFFSSLQRHLEIPASPRPRKADQSKNRLPTLIKQVERLEVRIKLLEEEQRQKGIDLAQFYSKPTKPDRSMGG